MKKLLGIVIVVFTFFVIQPTKVESYQDMYKDLLKIGQDIAEKNAQKKSKKAQKKFELAKWDLKKKDLVALKFEEIKSLFSGNVFFGEYNDNEIKGRFKEIYYEDGKYRGYVFGQEKKILFEKVGDPYYGDEAGRWYVIHRSWDALLCYHFHLIKNNQGTPYHPCVTVYKSKTNPNVYFLKTGGVLYQKFDVIKIISIKEQTELERIAGEKEEEKKRKAKEKRKEELKRKDEEKRKAEDLASPRKSLINDISDIHKFRRLRSELSIYKPFPKNSILITCDHKPSSEWIEANPDELYWKKVYYYKLPSGFKIRRQRSDRDYLEEDSKVKVLDAKGTVITFHWDFKAEYVYEIDFGTSKFPIYQIKPTLEEIASCEIDKLWEDARKFINAYQDKEQKEEEAFKEKQKKEYEEKEAYDNSPEGQLHNVYLSYLVIKGYYEARKEYAIQYVTSKQMSDARSKIKEIENTIVKENKIDSETIWNKAVKTYEDKEKAWMDGLISSGSYTEGNAQLAKRNLYFLTVTYNNVTGGTKIEKDF